MTDSRPIDIAREVTATEHGCDSWKQFAHFCPALSRQEDTKIATLYTALESAGYRIVGKEPTEEMVRAVFKIEERAPQYWLTTAWAARQIRAANAVAPKWGEGGEE